MRRAPRHRTLTGFRADTPVGWLTGGFMACSATERKAGPDTVKPAEPRRSANALGTRTEPVLMRVTEVRTLSKRILHLGFCREDGGGFEFRPGQFCRLAVPTAMASVWRSYSIATQATAGSLSETCEIAVTAMPGGLASAYLFGLKVGDRIRVSGPFGRLVLPDTNPAHYLLIGTGTGMAPYRAMLPELERRAHVAGVALRVTLLMGVREPADCLYATDFLNFVARSPDHRRLLVSYSRTLPVEPAWFERRGYVQDRLRELGPSSQRDRVMLCGNPDMIDTCSDILVMQGFDKAAIAREKYLAGPPPR